MFESDLRSRARTALLLALVVPLASLSACGDDDGAGSGTSGSEDRERAADETPVPGGKLVYGLTTDADGWVPGTNRWTSGGLNIARAVYDPLAAFDADGVPHPYLAEKIEPSDDFKTWVITLRDGVMFHDGTALDADAVVANLESVRASGLIGPTFELIDSIEATGPLVVTVSMTEPWSSFPVLLAQQPGFVVHPGMITGELGDPVGTGPFVYESWIPGDRFVATRNPDYWRTDGDGTRLPYLNEVEFRVVTETVTRQTAIAGGDLDVMHTASASSLVEYGADRDPGEGMWVTYSPGADDEQLIALNTQTGATADPDLRRALALATDRGLLNDTLNEGLMELAEAPFPADSPWYTDPGWPEPDRDAARELVAAVAARGGDTTVTLTVVSGLDDLEVGQAIAEQWEAAGITVEINAPDAAALILDIVTGNYEAAVFALFNSPDPDGDYHFWDPSNVTEPGGLSLAFTRYESTTLKDAMDAARRTTDEAARAEAWASVWKEVAEELPLIWLWHTQFLVVSHDNVRGIDTPTLPGGEPAQVVMWGSVSLTETWLTS